MFGPWGHKGHETNFFLETPPKVCVVQHLITQLHLHVLASRMIYMTEVPTLSICCAGLINTRLKSTLWAYAAFRWNIRDSTSHTDNKWTRETLG